MELTAVDLFCGCGGLSTGLSQAGFAVRAGFDNWKDAIRVYKANAAGNHHQGFVHDMSDEDATIAAVRAFDPAIVAGGPPCQDFSAAGKRTEGDRADLTVSFANVVAAVGPVGFVMENVPEAQKSKAFQRALDIFSDAGYGTTVKVLNAAFCGVPQLRKRMFVVGMKGERDGFLDEAIGSGVSPAPMTVRQYLGDELDLLHYYRHPRTYGRRAIFSVEEPSPTIRGINRPMPKTYRKHEADAVRPSAKVRSLTFRERSRIQTFPSGYFDGLDDIPKGSLDQMVGNAVPVALARFVGERLRAHLVSRLESPEIAESAVTKELRRQVAEIASLIAPHRAWENRLTNDYLEAMSEALAGISDDGLLEAAE